MSFGVFLYYTTMYVLTVLNKFPLTAVLYMLPLVSWGTFLIIVPRGFIISKIPARGFFALSMASFLAGNTLMSFASFSNAYATFVACACLLVVNGPDLSFAGARVLIFDLICEKEQGVAGLFIETVVHYSISIRLGLGAVVEEYTNLPAYRGAYYFGCGLAAVGFSTAISFVHDYKLKEAGRIEEPGNETVEKTQEQSIAPMED